MRARLPIPRRGAPESSAAAGRLRTPGVRTPRSPGARWGSALALLLLGAAGAVAWWSVLGSGLLWAAAPVLVSALVAGGLLRPLRASLLLLVWIPVALLVAGVPLAELRPRALADSVSAFGLGLDALTIPGRGPVLKDPWPLGAALVSVGAIWWTAAALAHRHGRSPAMLAVALTSLPLVGALALQQTGDAAWPGAVVLAAGVLWIARGRLLAVVPATLGVALVTAVAAQALGPEERWIPFLDVGPKGAAFTRLDTTQTYGPLNDRRTGATMLEITADRPALWRMQVLEYFDTRAWGVSVRPRRELSQPAAVPVETKVTVRGLRNRLVAAPGRVESVDGGGGSYQDVGEARQLRRSPDPGDTYTATSQVTEATVRQLEAVEVPTGAQYERYIQVFPGQYRGRRGHGRRGYGYGYGSGNTYGSDYRNEDGTDDDDGRFQLQAGRPAIDLLDGLTPEMRDSTWGRALALAQRLSSGTSSQFEIVRRVQDYLIGGDRYRYTTDVPEPGALPLLDFLFKDKAGYCQQFAGAAGLLLRMAGVPTRVVAGFATGVPDEDGVYDVRDKDAHVWVEVYFPGYGWVPFNPTPAAADAAVDPTLDLLAPAGGRGGGDGAGGALLLVPVGGGLVLAGVAAGRRRRRRHVDRPAVPVGELLARLVPGPVGPATTLTTLRPQLLAVGPAVAAIAAEEEHARFSGEEPPAVRHPRLRVWRALGRDVGVGRATVMVLRALAPSAPAPWPPSASIR